jgi:RNase P/RNase MRP subunit p29
MLIIKMTLTEKEVMIQKKGTKVRVRLEDGPEGRPGTADIDCDRIMFRPEDRIKRVRK